MVLKRFSIESSFPSDQIHAECGRVLKEEMLLDFQGEKVLIVDSPCTAVVPKQIYDQSLAREMLEKTCSLKEHDQIHHRTIRNSSFYLIFAVPESVIELQELFQGEVKIIHSLECLVSLADQVQASDHQRGVVLIDVQPSTLEILVIQGDQIKLLNRFQLGDPSECIYHTLNTLKQLNIDREAIPIYLSGIIHEEHELFGMLGKYIRRIRTTPYYMEELSKVEMLRSMILSEGSKCA